MSFSKKSKNKNHPKQRKEKRGWINRLFSRDSPPAKNVVRGNSPAIISASEHNISLEKISPHAVQVLEKLNKAGYGAYLVGGAVRDLMLGKSPKDFDVATDATPEQVKAVFRNCRLIGRRFRLAHVYFGRDEIIEVATFRASSPDQQPQHIGKRGRRIAEGIKSAQSESGMILRDNIYGTLEEDAWRRDFTINALYFNIADHSVVDYTGGASDLQATTMRLIGDSELRYREDPVRMLRAVRFAVKLDFQIEEQSETFIHEFGHLLAQVPQARLYDEFLKMFQTGQAEAMFDQLRHYGLFEYLFPLTHEWIQEATEDQPAYRLLLSSLQNTDQRIADGKSTNPAFLIAALLWEPVRKSAEKRSKAEPQLPEMVHLHRAGKEILRHQRTSISMPKRFALMAQEIWELQPRFVRRRGNQAYRLLEHPRFRAAYDFLLLRVKAGETDDVLAEGWTKFQDCNSTVRRTMVDQLGGSKKRKRRPRRRKKPDTKPDLQSELNEMSD